MFSYSDFGADSVAGAGKDSKVLLSITFWGGVMVAACGWFFRLKGTVANF